MPRMRLASRTRTIARRSGLGTRLLSAMRYGMSTRPRSEERRVGKECRSLCDWSSDVCSSDLDAADAAGLADADHRTAVRLGDAAAVGHALRDVDEAEIGRASCRERV